MLFLKYFIILHVDKFENLELLLRASEAPNARDLEGKTALFKAVNFNKIYAIQLLLSHGARACIKDKNGLTPFQFLGKDEKVKNLLLYGELLRLCVKIIRYNDIHNAFNCWKK